MEWELPCEHQDVAVLSDAERLENQGPQLTSRHEESFDLRMRNGERLIVLQLLLETGITLRFDPSHFRTARKRKHGLVARQRESAHTRVSWCP